MLNIDIFLWRHSSVHFSFYLIGYPERGVWENNEKCIWLSWWDIALMCGHTCLVTCCVLIWNGEKCDRKWFSVTQSGPNRTSKIAAGGHFEKKFQKKSCVLIWNGEKCIRKWFSVIQNGRRQSFCEFKKNLKVAYWSEMARNVIESIFRSSKLAAGSHLVNKFKNNKVAYWSEMARNAIQSDFR